MSMAGRARTLTPSESERLTVVVKALIAEHGSASKLATAMKAAGLSISQPVLSAQERGEPGGYHLAKQVAGFRRTTVEEILTGAPSKGGPRWRELPGWAREVEKARALFPKVSALAFDRLGNLMGERPPSVSALTIGLLASTWDNCSTDDARIEAIATNARRDGLPVPRRQPPGAVPRSCSRRTHGGAPEDRTPPKARPLTPRVAARLRRCCCPIAEVLLPDCGTGCCSSDGLRPPKYKTKGCGRLADASARPSKGSRTRRGEGSHRPTRLGVWLRFAGDPYAHC